MTVVTGFTSARMLEIENSTITEGEVVDDNLILYERDGTPHDVGSVRGPMGPAGSGHEIVTSSTHPSYAAGDEGKTIYETDTNLVRIWNGSRFEIQGPVICTSTTRPALVAADEGLQIYETDTNFRYFWNGTAWRRPAGDMGRLGSQSTTVDNDCGSTVETVVDIEIVTTEQRIVMINAAAHGTQVTNSSVSVSAYVDSTGTYDVNPNKNVFYSNSLSVGEPIVGSVCFTVTLPAGTTTFRLRARSATGAIRMSDGCQISVTDIAPG